MGDVLEPQPLQLGGVVTGDLAERAVDAHEAAVERDQRHPDRRLVEGEPETFLGLAQRKLGSLDL